MRFGRRRKGPVPTPPLTSGATTAPLSAEHEADLNVEKPEPLGGTARSSPFPDEPVMTGDPTQRLLTCLGRFQRQFMRGKTAISQEEWSDECMTQLIHSVEIAVENGLGDLVEALTETGRVLQSYEDAGRAAECIPFLSDSYEMVCLMVGDLIVGRKRSDPAVVAKWRARHQTALQEMEAAGIPLVQDDEDAAGRHAGRVGAPQARAQAAPAVGTEEPAAVESANETDFADEPAQPGSGTLSGPRDESDSAGFEQNALFDFDTEAAGSEPSNPAPGAHGLEPALAMLLDSWCDDLALLERAADRELPSVFTSMRQHMGELSHAAVERGWNAAARACETLERLCDAIETKASARDDRFFELAYGFGGIYAEGALQGEGPGVLNWISECEDFLDFDRARPSLSPASKAGAPEEASAVAGVSSTTSSPFEDELSEVAPFGAIGAAVQGAPRLDSSLDADDLETSPTGTGETAARSTTGDDTGISELLETARRAAAKGSHVDAKLLAMQAALGIAKTQTHEAEARVRQAEIRIQDGGRAIDQARQRIAEIEAEVGQAELQVDECRKQLAERGRHTQGVQTGVDGLHARLAELERRLRELQEQIEVAQRQRVAAEEALAEALAQENRARQSLDGAIQQEDAARARLEEARQHLKALQRKQGNYEAVMERAREALARQRDSVKDIEATIAQIRSTEASEHGGSEELLF